MGTLVIQMNGYSYYLANELTVIKNEFGKLMLASSPEFICPIATSD